MGTFEAGLAALFATAFLAGRQQLASTFSFDECEHR
jgi:hypothetical protein